MPVTSQINPAMYQDFFEPYVKEGKDVLYISFSSGLSGSYQSSMLARIWCWTNTRKQRSYVWIPGQPAVGQGAFLYEIVRKKREGLDLDAACRVGEADTRTCASLFMVEDLFHLKRGDVYQPSKRWSEVPLKSNPILSVDEEGKLVIRSKARGTNKAMEYLIAKTVEEGGDLSTLRAVIGHADCIEKAEKLKQMAVDAGMQADNLMIAPIGPIIGTHVGSGMLAIAFVTNM